MFTFHYVNREQDFLRDHRSAGANNVLDILGNDTKGNFLEKLMTKLQLQKGGGAINPLTLLCLRPCGTNHMDQVNF